MADWFLATEGVKIVKDSASLWPQIITAVSSAGAALGGVGLTHFFTRQREKAAAEDSLTRERLFIATELVFILERYAEGCARVANDYGEEQPPYGELEPTVMYPELDLTDVSGNWRVLPGMLMYRIRELPVLQNEARRTISGVREYDHPPFFSDYFHERQYQYARLGMKALLLAMRMRRAVGLPETRLADTEWSAHPVLWKVWRQERRRRTERLLDLQKEFAEREAQDVLRDVQPKTASE